MSHSRTHHTTLARRLSRSSAIGYQQALQQVRAAAAAGSLPAVLDDAGMAAALSTLAASVRDGQPAAHVCGESCQRFRFFAREWCVTHALELIDTDPGASMFIPNLVISALDDHLGLTPLEPNQGRIQWFPIDTEAAATADLSVPLLIIRLLDEGENEGKYVSDFIIDGWERAYRARSEGRMSLPAYQLSDAAERAVRR